MQPPRPVHRTEKRPPSSAAIVFFKSSYYRIRTTTLMRSRFVNYILALISGHVQVGYKVQVRHDDQMASHHPPWLPSNKLQKTLLVSHLTFPSSPQNDDILQMFSLNINWQEKHMKDKHLSFVDSLSVWWRSVKTGMQMTCLATLFSVSPSFSLSHSNSVYVAFFLAHSA